MDHIRAFRQYSRNAYTIVDSAAFEALEANLDVYDCLVLHYSIVISMESFIPNLLREKIRLFKGIKVAFIQDEYRIIDRQNAALADLKIGVIFTVTNREVTRKIYRDAYFDGVRFEHTLTGFVPEHLLSLDVPKYSERPLDVSYRARKSPPWYGYFAEEKWQIAERFAADATDYGLVCDIDTSETSRIYGNSWVEFVASSKAVLGTESGVSFIDFAGDAQVQVERFCAENPDVPGDVVRHKFLGADDGKIVIHVISPRIFEAAALRTLMILYEGEYSGAVKPWDHYVPLNRDHSNMAEVVSVIRDRARAQSIIDRAFDEVARSSAWTFKAMIDRFDTVVDDEAQRIGIAHDRPMDALDAVELAVSTRGLELLSRGRYLQTQIFPVYTKLVGDHQGLVDNYERLAKSYHQLAEHHQQLVLDHQRLARMSLRGLASRFRRMFPLSNS
ncbi:hypothetical protein [Bradyrhizobium sp. I1.14.4]|uniref:hypothetical protein n=1 Tax=unclassified Bradyrhizobium TaxID=2631580 RepID=UPI003D20FB67